VTTTPRIIGALSIAGVAFGAITWRALEGDEVVVLRTVVDDNGSARETRVWIVEQGGFLWIESATPERPFYLDIQRDSHVELQRDGRRQAYRAEAIPGGDGHEKIRTLLRDRYGWKDRWIGMLADTSASIAIRLKPAD
jgi:hypothetical protein